MENNIQRDILMRSAGDMEGLIHVKFIYQIYVNIMQKIYSMRAKSHKNREGSQKTKQKTAKDNWHNIQLVNIRHIQNTCGLREVSLQ